MARTAIEVKVLTAITCYIGACNSIVYYLAQICVMVTSNSFVMLGLFLLRCVVSCKYSWARVATEVKASAAAAYYTCVTHTLHMRYTSKLQKRRRDENTTAPEPTRRFLGLVRCSASSPVARAASAVAH